MNRAASALALGGAVVAADQATKALVRAALAPGEVVDLALGVQLRRVQNSGAAFGLFAGEPGAMIVVTVAAILAIGVYLARNASRPWAWAAAALVAGGAAGNLTDRVRDGAVSDFLDPPAWPAFNLADVAIVAGVGLILLGIFRERSP